MAKEKSKKKDKAGSKKSTIHPNYKEIEVVMTDGTKFKTRSTISKQKVLELYVDPKSHVAWTKDAGANSKNTRFTKVRKFQEEYGDFLNIEG